jgi:hypothetical protein
MLKGQKLADVYANAYAESVMSEARTEAKPSVWAHYEGGGWITLRGEGLPPHYDLREQYPNGWTLLDHVRSSEARRFLDEQLP